MDSSKKFLEMGDDGRGTTGGISNEQRLHGGEGGGVGGGGWGGVGAVFSGFRETPPVHGEKEKEVHRPMYLQNKV